MEAIFEHRAEWGVIEQHYRGGKDSTRGIARRFELTEAAIRKRAREHGWGPNPYYERKLQAGPKHNAPPARRHQGHAPGFVYVIYVDAGGERFYKIGHSKGYWERIEVHQCGCPFEIRTALCYYVNDMRAEEQILHAWFEAKRVRGEWFDLTRDDLDLIARRTVVEGV